jgi:hypothetical protein
VGRFEFRVANDLSSKARSVTEPGLTEAPTVFNRQPARIDLALADGLAAEAAPSCPHVGFFIFSQGVPPIECLSFHP